MEAISPDSLDVIVANERDRRTLAYLVDTCGPQRVAKARQALPGRTRPYVSNIARILGVTIPEAVVITPRAEGRRQLSEIKRFLTARAIAAPAPHERRN
ncbi:cryptic plasmid protein A [Paraburkholderia kururiensis]|uniref:cryptic plasmid protein A n=1 Tax=Paraburkholderia kururiensis TaxID=984307 RepID=UPI0039A4B926